MAWYKYEKYLDQNTHANFDKEWKPGETPPDNGIYRCKGCGLEIASNQGVKLPPQNHHQHSAAQGSIRWQMIVCCENR